MVSNTNLRAPPTSRWALKSNTTFLLWVRDDSAEVFEIHELVGTETLIRSVLDAITSACVQLCELLGKGTMEGGVHTEMTESELRAALVGDEGTPGAAAGASSAPGEVGRAVQAIGWVEGAQVRRLKPLHEELETPSVSSAGFNTELAPLQ